MDFDHRPGSDKKFDISQNFFQKEFDEVLEEVAKCDIVCACCHRTRTHQRRQYDAIQYGKRLLAWDHYEMTRGEQEDIIRFHSRVPKGEVVATPSNLNEHSSDKSDAH